jgi:hypothetical protein
MPNLYITPAEIKDSIPDLIDAVTTKYDDALLRYAGRLSRFIDQHCERVFFPTSELRAFTGKGGRVMRIPDVLSISQLRYSEDDGATYTALTQSGNWHLARSGEFAHPGSYDQIVIDPNSTILGSWSTGIKAIELTGIWAYADDRDDCWEDSLDEVEDNPLAVGATEVTVNNAAGAGAFGPAPRFMAGMLARAGSEYWEISAVNTSTNKLTVLRGRNGTTAAQQAQNTQIDIWRPPGPVVDAAQIQVVRSHMRATQGYADSRANADIGQLFFLKKLDPEAQEKLQLYVLVHYG